jgi:hypothetical protein
MPKKYFFLIPAIINLSGICSGSSGFLGPQFSQTDTVFKQKIHTVSLYRENWPLSLPILSLGENQNLVLSFDELSNIQENYSWALVHCTKDWEPDETTSQEFAEGFVSYEIENAKPSFNTTTFYWSYQLLIPGPDLKINYSGNYLIRIFLRDFPDSLILQRRFMVTEGLVRMDAVLKRPAGVDFNTGQEIECSLSIPASENMNASALFMDVLVNYRWNSMLRNAALTDKGNGNLKFELGEQNIFPGGSEYLNLDLKNLKYLSSELMSVEYKPPFFRIETHPDRFNPYGKYYFDNDLNGKYLIQADGTSSSRVEADYSEVHFYLPVGSPFDGDLFVSGDFSLRSLDPQYKLKYNLDLKRYELAILLKQGYYNYEYLFRTKSGKPDYTWVNGSHFETENDYLFLVYYTDFQKGIDRLIGNTIFNTLHQGK